MRIGFQSVNIVMVILDKDD